MKKLSVLLLSCAVAACGGGGGGSSDSSDTGSTAQATAQVGGKVYVGAFQDAQVRVYAWDGGKGAEIGSAAADAQGNYSISLGNVSAEVALIEVRGSYIESGSGDLVVMDGDDRLQALVRIGDGGTITTAVTPFTTITTGLATYKTTLGLSPAQAVAQAINEVSGWTGVDVQNTVPVDVHSAAGGALSGSAKAGFLASGISYMADAIGGEDTTSLEVTEAAYQDVLADGRLDGVADSGPIRVAGMPFSVDTFRHELAVNMVAAADATSYSVSDVFSFGSTVNQASGALFNNDQSDALDSSAPLFANVSLFNGQAVAGVLDVTATAVALEGIDETAMYVNGSLHQYGGKTTTPAFTLDTRSYGDGPLIVTLEATDNRGGLISKDIELYVDNAAPVISNFVPADGSRIGGMVNFQADASSATGIQSARFLLDGNQVYIPRNGDPSTPSVIIDTATIASQRAQHSMTLEVTSQSGVKATQTINFFLDNVDPSMTWNLDSEEHLSGVFRLSGVASDDEAFKESRLFVAGTQEMTFISETFGYDIDTRTYADGDYAIAMEVEDQTGNVKTYTKTVLFDNTDPMVRITSPANGSTITSDFNIVANVSDEGGLDGEVVFLVDGVQYSTAFPDDTVSTEVNANNYSNGQHTIGVRVTDRAGHTTTETVTVTFSL